ncbi:MAG TPA: TIGR00366 family protein [Acidobacteriota bacterium]|nr:TIGR00366 family protein [Acidobacteriota bacterium]
MKFLARIALALNNWTSRWVPSAFAIALILTLISLAAGWLLTPHSLLECLRFWGDGFWELLSFSMQMTLIMVTGYIVVVSPPVNRALRWFAGLPRSATGAIAFTALGAMVLAWINWGLGILGAAVLVKYIARRHPDVDYRLLVAVAYFGLGCTWHAGLSASAPVLVATPGHFMEKQMGVIPLSRTIFHPFNLSATVAVIILMTTVAWLLHPRNPADRKRVDPSRLENIGAFQPPAPESKERYTPSDFLDYTYALNLVLGLCGLVWLYLNFTAKGWQGLTINTVNFIFLTAGILFHPSPASVLKAAAESGSTIYNIALQFPFYSGMYGIIKGTALSDLIGQAFVRIATPKTLPLIVYWYSGIVNYFVPSGGSKWAVEAPYVIQAAGSLGVAFDRIVVAYAWGDMMTDLLQPFWAIPLLAAAGIEFKEILGYEMIACLLYAALVSLFFYFLPFY